MQDGSRADACQVVAFRSWLHSSWFMPSREAEVLISGSHLHCGTRHFQALIAIQVTCRDAANNKLNPPKMDAQIGVEDASSDKLTLPAP